MTAKHLHIKIVKNNIDLVDLTFPIFTLSIIDSVMPEMVLEKLKSRNIDLKLIISKVKDDNFRPQEIFCLEEDLKLYRVWIE